MKTNPLRVFIVVEANEKNLNDISGGRKETTFFFEDVY